MAETQEDANGIGYLQRAPVIGICVGREHKGIHALRWAIEKIIPSRGSVYLLHVKPPLRWIDGPMGGKIAVDQVDPKLVKRFKEDRFLDTEKLVDVCRKICDKNKVTSKLCYSENDSIHRAIVDQISKLGITNLILEKSSHMSFTRSLRGESISAYVARHAPDFCTVMVVRSGKLHSVRDATCTPSLHSSLRSSISAASDVSISTVSESSISTDEHLEDHLMANAGFYNGERGMQPVEPCSTSQGRLLQSTPMDNSQVSEWIMISNISDNVGYQDTAARLKMSDCSTLPPSRMVETAPPSPFHQQLWSSPDYWRSPDYNNARSISGFESHIASDGVSIHRTLNTSEPISNYNGDALSHTSTEVGNSTSSCTLKESSVQNLPVDSNSAFSSGEVLPTLEFDSLHCQLHEAKQSAQWAQREADRQANSSRMAEEVVANARKMIAEHVRHRDEALNEAKIALRRASVYEKKWEEAVATAQVALWNQEILKGRLAEEVRRHEETQNELEIQRRTVDAYAIAADLARQQAQAENSRCEDALVQLAEVTRKLGEECQLRKEAEERASQEAIAKREAIVALSKEQQKYTEYSFQEIQTATNNFHEENKLGEGGYGPVYKGKLHHTTVAIKVLAREGSQGRDEFQKEVEVLSCIHHPHMVMLLGACPEKGCIVYEYMANGSLEDRLNCRDGTPPLPWYVRFRICLEVATALLFLHSRPQPIVHRDLKPGNILLDHHFISKISDVGIAKLVPIDVTFSVTMYKETTIMGTWAYMDPDYQRTGVVSRESDVYSLGIVMLQLLTGQQPVGVAHVVEDAVEKNQLEDVLDKSAGEWPLMEAMALAHVSLQCTEPRRKHRPNLETKILPDLESIQSVAGIAAASMARVGPSLSGTMPMIPSSFFCPISQVPLHSFFT